MVNTLKKQALVSLVGVVLIVGCATDDPNRRAKLGGVIGAVAGGAIGAAAGGKGGAVVGLAAGGLAGYGVGRYMDRQQKELEVALADELESREIELTRLEGDVIRVNLSSNATFDSNESDLKPPFYPSLDKIVQVLSEYDQTQINVVGHTDNVGEENYNEALSERRSYSVADYLHNGGIVEERVLILGMGELSPRAPNDTDENRALNRRVEIELIPIVDAES